MGQKGSKRQKEVRGRDGRVQKVRRWTIVNFSCKKVRKSGSQIIIVIMDGFRPNKSRSTNVTKKSAGGGGGSSKGGGVSADKYKSAEFVDSDDDSGQEESKPQQHGKHEMLPYYSGTPRAIKATIGRGVQICCQKGTLGHSTIIILLSRVHQECIEEKRASKHTDNNSYVRTYCAKLLCQSRIH